MIGQHQPESSIEKRVYISYLRQVHIYLVVIFLLLRLIFFDIMFNKVLNGLLNISGINIPRRKKIGQYLSDKPRLFTILKVWI